MEKVRTDFAPSQYSTGTRSHAGFPFFSKVTLVVMGSHIGADAALPKPEKYSFRVTMKAGGKTGSAGFDYVLK
jgi:hypothetical protein